MEKTQSYGSKNTFLPQFFVISHLSCTFAVANSPIMSTLLAILLTIPFTFFRAAWFSTVANIDWPSPEAVGNSQMQQREMLMLLDSMQALGMNAVVFQARPTADALYLSDLEPWSAWLTGQQGKDNDFPYDPLEMMVREAHKRNMEVHVWVNPYRVTLATTRIEDVAPNHLWRTHPEMFWKYNGQWYFEPGLDETRDWLCRVVADIVRRYDIEAIHMDDYFYPYPDHRTSLPDRACFEAHPRGFDNIEDWRRNNVNMAIHQLHDTIKSIKPNVQFGISPFGIWRNLKNDSVHGSATNGLQNYDELYADVRLWMEKGWIDYVVPQLYWHIGHRAADHATLARWWSDNCFQTRLYIGMGVYQLLDSRQMSAAEWKKKSQSAWAQPNELCRQLALHRELPNIRGQFYFSLNHLLKNPQGICDSLRSSLTLLEKPALQDFLPLPADSLTPRPLSPCSSVSSFVPASAPNAEVPSALPDSFSADSTSSATFLSW